MNYNITKELIALLNTKEDKFHARWYLAITTSQSYTDDDSFESEIELTLISTNPQFKDSLASHKGTGEIKTVLFKIVTTLYHSSYITFEEYTLLHNLIFHTK